MATAIPENKARFTLDEVLTATGGSLVVQGSARETTSVSTDTRTIEPGALFVALRGDSFDAHDRIAEAATKGARVAIVERDVTAPPGMGIVRVGSTLDALGALARRHVERWRAGGRARGIIAITGSAGKTTTRVATAALLEACFSPSEILATAGNLNNRVGLPMMVFCLEDRHLCAVLEMGMNQPGEIDALAAIASPNISVVTLVAAAHVEGLGSIEGVAHEKGALFRSLSVDDVAIGNGDDPRVVAQMTACRAKKRIRYGASEGVDLRIVERRPEGLTSSRVTLERRDGSRISFRTPLLGEAGAYASAAAVAVLEEVLALGEPPRARPELLEKAFAQADVGGGAGRLVPRLLGRDVVVIDDSYNANPASSAASIRTATELARASNRRLVLVLGAMYELGIESERGHDEVGRVAGASGAALVFAIGGEARRIADRAIEAGIESRFFPTSADAAASVAAAVRPSDLVLVKGSRGVGTEKVVRALELALGQGASQVEVAQ
jgi:UDP-N-acetylmuramoyl-tripeptide--D-alanyl-D-alanine ligase